MDDSSNICPSAEESKKLEVHKRWLDLMESHKKEWKNVGINSDLESKINEIKLLDNQLKAYFSYERCKNSSCFLSGIGNCNASVVFLGLNPNSYDMSKGEVFAGKTGEYLVSKIKQVVEIDKCYFMYVFPYDIGKIELDKSNKSNDRKQDRVVDQFEQEIFMAYAARRIDIIKPSLIVLIGAKSYSYAFAGFEFSKINLVKPYHELKMRQLNDLPNKIKMGDREINLLLCPHPFQMTSFVKVIDGRQVDESKSDANVIINTYWSNCFTKMDQLLNANRIKGEEFITNTGEIAIDPSSVMKKTSKNYFDVNEAKKKLKKKPTSKKKNSYYY